MQPLKILLKRALISLLKLFPQYVRRFYLPSVTLTLDKLNENYALLYRNRSLPINNILPATSGPQHHAFVAQTKIAAFDTSVIQTHQWRVWGNQGAVITANNHMLADASREFGNIRHSIYLQFRLVQPVLQKGKIAVLAASGAHVYYHWMVDILPRIGLLKKSGIFNSIEHFVINCNFNKYQNETLARAGIRNDQVIQSLNHWQFHMTFPDLVVPSLVSANDTPSLAACEFLRALFSTELAQAADSGNIYITRSSGRKVANDGELSSFLDQHNFRAVALERLSVAEQARLFSGAKTVVGAHGSGLTNIVFCQPGTIVIDLFSSEWVNPCYWIIAEHVKLRYGYLTSDEIPGSIKTDKDADIYVNVKKLSTLFNRLHSAR